MGTFGETLRQEREFRGITLDAITRVTKISNRHLLALEQEHFNALPGGVFNKSMVRQYARVVGLDQDEWVGRYLSAYQLSGGPADEDGWMRFAENASKTRGGAHRHGPDQRLRWAGIAVLLLLVTGLTWFVWTYVQKKMSLSLPATAPTSQTTTLIAPQSYLRLPAG
jgi:cytoskeleton protein RodZ